MYIAIRKKLYEEQKRREALAETQRAMPNATQQEIAKQMNLDEHHVGRLITEQQQRAKGSHHSGHVTSNVEEKYYTSAGTPVHGRKDTKVIIPDGATTTQTPTTKREIAGSLYSRMGYDVKTIDGQTIATKGRTQVIIDKEGSIISEGRVTNPTYRPEFERRLGSTKMSILSERQRIAKSTLERVGFDTQYKEGQLVAQRGEEQVIITPHSDITTKGKITPILHRLGFERQVGSAEMSPKPWQQERYAKARFTYDKIERNVGNAITNEPLFILATANIIKGQETIEKLKNKLSKSQILGQGRQGTISGQLTGLLKASEHIYQIEEKYTRDLGTKPITTGVKTLGFYGVGATFGAFRTILPPGTGLAAKLARTQFNLVGLGFGGMYGYSKYKQYQDVEKKGYVTADILREVGAVGVGSQHGEHASIKIQAYFKTLGKEKIPPEKIIEPKVLTGEKTFPEARQDKHLNLFKNSEYQLAKIEKLTGSRYEKGGYKEISIKDYPLKTIRPPLGVWHAYRPIKPSVFQESVLGKFGDQTTVKVGTEYLPGGFVAPSLSAYFLGIRKGIEPPSLYGFDRPSGVPTALHIYPDGIKNIPKAYKGKEYGFLLDKAQKGKAYVPEIKTEIEALIPPDSVAIPLSSDYFTTWRGVRVPIREVKLESGIKKGTIIKEVIKKTSSSYRPSPLITPSVLAGAYLESKVEEKSSLIDSKISRINKSYLSRLSEKRSVSEYDLLGSEVSSKLGDRSYLPSDRSMSSAKSSLLSRISDVKSYLTSKGNKGSYVSSTKKSYLPHPPLRKRKDAKKRIAEIKEQIKQGYIALIKRKGEFLQISSPVTQDVALDIGSGVAAKTLGATFKVVPTNEAPMNTKPTGEFAKLRQMFRDYKIRKGQKIALEEGEYIQKRGTRLGRKEEVEEILKAKRKKVASLMQTQVKQQKRKQVLNLLKSNARRKGRKVKWI